MRADMKKVVDELVSTYFEQSNEELCANNVYWDLRDENRFSRYTPYERVVMFMEVAVRLDGEYALDGYYEYYGKDLAVMFV